MTHRLRGAAFATLVLTLAACGTTTIVSGPSTTAVGDTTTVPTGTIDDLLGRLNGRAFALGAAIVDGEGEPALGEIEALWAAAAARLPRTEFVVSVERQLGLMRNAVVRHRAADADKSARHLEALVKSRPAG